MKIFITGESGVIPLAIQRYADEFGFEIVNTQLKKTDVDTLKMFQAFSVRKPEIDFTSKHLFKSAVEITKPDVIIHSGAFVGTDFCLQSKEEAVNVNVFGTQNVVDVCNEFGINLVYFSTTAIFNPKDYSESKPITENTNINPQTLYGITKYAGELVAKNVCKTKKLIIRPVFGFGDYPDDLHSALTKLIYILSNNEDKTLKILLNMEIGKSYFRVENIAYSVLLAIKQGIWDKEVNIGENYNKRKNWHEILKTIFSFTGDKSKELEKRVKFIPEDDYLHFHNIDNSFMNDLGLSKEIMSFEKGVESTVNSVNKNINIKPYWIS